MKDCKIDPTKGSFSEACGISEERLIELEATLRKQVFEAISKKTLKNAEVGKFFIEITENPEELFFITSMFYQTFHEMLQELRNNPLMAMMMQILSEEDLKEMMEKAGSMPHEEMEEIAKNHSLEG